MNRAQRYGPEHDLKRLTWLCSEPMPVSRQAAPSEGGGRCRAQLYGVATCRSQQRGRPLSGTKVSVRWLSRDASESSKLFSSTPAARHIDGTTVSEEGAQVLRTVKPDACTLSELRCSEPLITETAIHIF